MTFPDGFLWGAATAAHQVEGGNVTSDFWALEHAPGSMFAEPSGDACDHYRLYREDIGLLRDLGFTAYRFSIEWARVEPEDGFVSRAAIAHYRDVLEACHEAGITPMVTLHHFTSPHWLMDLGGWEYDGTPERFAAYCHMVMDELGPLIPYAATINEANIARLTRRMIEGFTKAPEQAPVGVGRDRPDAASRPNTFLFTWSDTGLEVVKRAHVEARRAIKNASPSTRVGATFALQDYQSEPGGEKAAEERWAESFEDFLPALDGDDFLGVQNYSRVLVGADGTLPHPEGAELTQMGYEFYPQALENVLRRAASAGLPMFVTEHGIATGDDARRVEFVRRALVGLERCVADGVDVRGYFHWSMLDNFEWMLGYAPAFGLIAVDRTTQRRTVKDSARVLGNIARRNALA
ncbi:glycoside hydrolase family 1 protein [Actinomadura sp. WMMB 499]|uniref:glycoside hydrolase family 1 protein n=1 Tax=Actinomadura sp. WMMB 499 TaxID=1219491 RepID=UPI001245DCFB|nr:family 1 glycosylhydrolase [Actinomadura sp. WMMB 499]QFG22157.1 family 1 glycosylhydrolase [Actinomadura sp. WMMB 499]